MSQEIRIFYNPKCSKCQLTMGILKDKGITASVIEYLDTPPDMAELNHILDLLGLEPRDLMRTFEAPYKENNLGAPNLSREQLIQAMIDHPILIERPIVISGNQATIARPPEKVLDLLK